MCKCKKNIPSIQKLTAKLTKKKYFFRTILVLDLAHTKKTAADLIFFCQSVLNGQEAGPLVRACT